MDWSHDAMRAGVVSEDEWREVNHLANRLAFAEDRARPALVAAGERGRFAELSRRVVPQRRAMSYDGSRPTSGRPLGAAAEFACCFRA